MAADGDPCAEPDALVAPGRRRATSPEANRVDNERLVAGPEADDADGVADIATNGVADRAPNGATNADGITDGDAAAGDLLADPRIVGGRGQDFPAD